MADFKIDVETTARASTDEPRGLAVRAGEVVFTRLLRPGSEQPDDYLLAPPASLAFWLVDNWWRLRWECEPPTGPTPKWRLAHDLASIGGGYVWPRLTIWSEGERIGLVCHSDPPGVVGPVRFITDTSPLFIPSSSFEGGVDAFLAIVADSASGFGSDRAALKAQIDALKAERDDSEFAAWRRLEAQLGFDPDEAPQLLMNELSQLSARYGTSGVEEAAQACPGSDAAKVLKTAIAAVNNCGWSCDFSQAVRAAGFIDHSMVHPPWRAAVDAGHRVRNVLGIGTGAVNNDVLVQLLHVDPRALDEPNAPPQFAYGLRVKPGQGAPDLVSLRSRWPANRRFHLTRALGDAIWSGDDTLGPLTQSKTARQKFQRAFAQNLLCPYDDLMSYIDTTNPTDEDIEAAAKHFDVSERVVQNTLVNNGVLLRERFEAMVDEAA